MGDGPEDKQCVEEGLSVVKNTCSLRIFCIEISLGRAQRLRKLPGKVFSKIYIMNHSSRVLRQLDQVQHDSSSPVVLPNCPQRLRASLDAETSCRFSQAQLLPCNYKTCITVTDVCWRAK